MNKQEIYDGLWRITKEKQDACKAEAEAVDRDHPTERGALQLKAGIYHVAIAAGLISGVNRAADIMSKRFVNLMGHFPDLAVYYHGLTDEEKGIMAVSLYPELFMRASFYNTYKNPVILKPYSRQESKKKFWMRFWTCGVASEFRTVCLRLLLIRRTNYEQLTFLSNRNGTDKCGNKKNRRFL